MRHLEDLKKLQQKGRKMVGNIGNIDYENSQKHLLEELFKVLKYTHKRQQDLLVFAQKGDKDDYEDNFLTYDQLVAATKQKQKALKMRDDAYYDSSSEEDEGKVVKLPNIKSHKYPNLSI